MIQYLNYEGKKIPFRISYYAITKWSAETGKTLAEMDDIGKDFSLMEPLLWYAIKAGCNADKVDLPFEREQMEFAMDDLLEGFTEAMGDFSQGDEEALTKKRTPTKKETRKKVVGK